MDAAHRHFTNNFNWSAYMQHTLLLPADFRFMLTYRYNSKEKSAYGRSDSYHDLSFSIMRQLLDKRLTLKLAANELLWAQKPWTHTNTGDIYSATAMYGRHLPSLVLSAYYTINKGKSFSHRDIEQSNKEEKSRAL